ncbi:MAG: heavy metal-responsive transcriptional regulator [Nitriliruptorales bacterium]
MLIGELAERSGTPRKTIRYYEDIGLIPAPGRTAGGYRDFADETLRRLDFVHAAKRAGFTLAQVRGILEVRDAGRAPCGHVTALVDEQIREVDAAIDELRRTRQHLEELAARASELDPADCTEDEVCVIIGR